MTTDLYPRQADALGDTLDERARRAVHAFRALQPVLTAYARSMTGKPEVRVEMSTTDNGSTDGKRIFMRPPLALGDNSRHDRNLCNKRGSDGYQLCPACAVRESVLRSIYHEIAHIAFGSFEHVSDYDKKQTVEFTVKELRSKWGDKLRERLKGRDMYSYMELASYINQFLPFLLNCMEDARVDSQMFKVRPGTRRMFEVETKKIFEEGFENLGPNGYENKKWSEAPLNSQLMIGTYLKASGYDYASYLHPEVISALDDTQVTGIISQISETKLASDVYRLALHVFARYRELGFFATDEDQDPQAGHEGESDESNGEPDQQESEPQAGTPNPTEDSGPESSPSGDSEDRNEHPEGQEPDSEGEAGDSGDGDESTRPEPSSDEQSSDGPDAGESESGEGDSVDEDDSSDSGEPSSDGNSSESDSEVGGSESNQTNGGPDSEASNGDMGSGSPDSKVPSEQEENTDPDSTTTDADSVYSGSESNRAEHGGEDSSDGLGGQSTDADAQGDEGGGLDLLPEHDESSSSDGPGGTDEPVDQGADDGYGGTDLEGDMSTQAPEMGEPDDISEVIQLFGDHDEKPKSAASEEEAHAIDKAVIQGVYFNKPSEAVFGVREHWVDKHAIVDRVDYSVGWYNVDPARAKRTGKSFDSDLDESILQPVLLEVRRTFSDNQRGRRDPNKKSGKINTAALGKRAWNNDPRLFAKTTRPGRKSYAVVLHMDLSGSTVGRNLALEKRAVMLQAEILDRAGISFAIVGHTGNYMDASTKTATSRELMLEIYHIKDFNQPWDEAKYALENISGHGVNLDGHALEFLRKMADGRRETDKVIMYYSDGKMPSTNHDEELDILQDEIKTCRDKKYTLLGVGIRTDSPTRHGLSTVQVDTDKDLSKVVGHLGRRLSETR